MARSPLALRCPRRQSALHTLIRQSHQAPSCGGLRPNAERTVGLARDFIGSLTLDPELENKIGTDRPFAAPPGLRPVTVLLSPWRRACQHACSLHSFRRRGSAAWNQSSESGLRGSVRTAGL